MGKEKRKSAEQQMRELRGIKREDLPPLVDLPDWKNKLFPDLSSIASGPSWGDPGFHPFEDEPSSDAAESAEAPGPAQSQPTRIYNDLQPGGGGVGSGGEATLDDIKNLLTQILAQLHAMPSMIYDEFTSD